MCARRALLVALTLSAVAAFARGQQNGPLPGPNPLFPPDNWWNVDVTAAPVDAGNAGFMAFYGGGTGFHPDFGGDNTDDPPHAIYGMPYISVSGLQARVPVTFTETPDESDLGYPGHPIGYPIPEAAKTESRWIEGGYPGNVDPGGDRHMLIVDRDNRILYELYRAFWNEEEDQWEAYSGAIYSLDANDRRPDGWTSADAAGLAIFPGLVRYDESFSGEPIRHAFRVTFSPSRHAYVYPASHRAGTTPAAFPMGTRLRLKSDVAPFVHANASQAEEDALIRIWQAMKTYGLIVADNGSDGYVQGVYDTRWDSQVFNAAFHALDLANFDVLQLGWRPDNTVNTAARQFYTLVPCRILDTRNAPGPYGYPPAPSFWTATQRPGPPAPPISPAMRVFVAHGRCGVPAEATAISTNVTVVSAPHSGHVSFFPGDQGVNPTTTINFGPGQTRANNAILTLSRSGSGAFGVSAISGNGLAVHVIVDVNGYFRP
jgi:hypothetical protein